MGLLYGEQCQNHFHPFPIGLRSGGQFTNRIGIGLRCELHWMKNVGDHDCLQYRSSRLGELVEGRPVES